MRAHLISFAICIFPIIGNAGYSAFKLVDYSNCNLYTFTGDYGVTSNQYFSTSVVNGQELSWVEAQRARLHASAAFDAYELQEHQRGKNDIIANAELVLCAHSGNRIHCLTPPTIPLPKLSCRLDQGRCDGASPIEKRFAMFSMDTTEYETGGGPDLNPAFDRARR